MKHFFIFLFWIPSALSAQIKVDSKGDKLKGNIRMMVDYQYSLFANSNKKRVPDQTAIYTYNEETKQETIYYYSGTDTLKWVYKNIIEFDGNNPVKNYHFSKAGEHGGYIQKDSICSLITYRYNDSGKPIEVSTSQNGFDSKTRYIYDGQGNVIETNDYRNEVSFDGIACKKSTFKYDNRGHVV
jgi:YD repeat-containing protein